MIPYQILNIPYDADTETIRAAYQGAIRMHPPETSPEEFKQINAAYEALKDKDLRLQREIGSNVKTGQEFLSPREATVAFLRADLSPTPPSADAFIHFLKA